MIVDRRRRKKERVEFNNEDVAWLSANKQSLDVVRKTEKTFYCCMFSILNSDVKTHHHYYFDARAVMCYCCIYY